MTTKIDRVRHHPLTLPSRVAEFIETEARSQHVTPNAWLTQRIEARLKDFGTQAPRFAVRFVRTPYRVKIVANLPIEIDNKLKEESARLNKTPNALLYEILLEVCQPQKLSKN